MKKVEGKLLVKNKNGKNKEKSKLITFDKAQKIPNTNYTSEFIGENAIVVQVPKEEVSKDEEILPMLNLALMFGLHQIGIKNIDVTMRETKDGYEVIIEK